MRFRGELYLISKAITLRSEGDNGGKWRALNASRPRRSYCSGGEAGRRCSISVHRVSTSVLSKYGEAHLCMVCGDSGNRKFGQRNLSIAKLLREMFAQPTGAAAFWRPLCSNDAI